MSIETFATTAFLTLFVIVDPIGLSSLFLGVTEVLNEERRRSTAVRAVIIAGLIRSCSSSSASRCCDISA
jgi:multiple antibiotic resistance protein